MRFVLVAQFILGAYLIFIAVTQIAMPLMRGVPMFPMFSRKRSRLEHKLAEKREDEELSTLEASLKSKKRGA